MNGVPFPTSDGVPYYNNPDAVGNLAMPVEQYIRNVSNIFVPVSSTNPLATADAATLAKLVEILGKLSADPATQTTLEAARVLLSTISGKDFATQATLNSILTQLGTTGLKKIIDALPAGANLIGKVGIDQTTPGTTNKVVAELSGSIPRGTNEIGKVQLTGRTIETAITRAVRKASFVSEIIQIPTGAKGVLVTLRIYGATGTFEEGEGCDVRIETGLAAYATCDLLMEVITPAKTSVSNKNHVIVIYPSNQLEWYHTSTIQKKNINGPLIGSICKIAVRISGTFTENEGIDCDAILQWLV